MRKAHIERLRMIERRREAADKVKTDAEKVLDAFGFKPDDPNMGDGSAWSGEYADQWPNR